MDATGSNTNSPEVVTSVLHHHHLHHHHHHHPGVHNNPNDSSHQTNPTPTGNNSVTQYDYDPGQYVDPTGQFVQYDPYYHSYYHQNSSYPQHQEHSQTLAPNTIQHSHNINSQQQHTTPSTPQTYNETQSDFYHDTTTYSMPYQTPVNNTVQQHNINQNNSQQVTATQDTEFHDVSFVPLFFSFFLSLLWMSRNNVLRENYKS